MHSLLLQSTNCFLYTQVFSKPTNMAVPSASSFLLRVCFPRDSLSNYNLTGLLLVLLHSCCPVILLYFLLGQSPCFLGLMHLFIPSFSEGIPSTKHLRKKPFYFLPAISVWVDKLQIFSPQNLEGIPIQSSSISRV